jgi:hypothetical protein
MFDVRKSRPHIPLHYLVLFLFAISILATAQDKGKEKESKKADAAGSGNLVKVGGTPQASPDFPIPFQMSLREHSTWASCFCRSIARGSSALHC